MNRATAMSVFNFSEFQDKTTANTHAAISTGMPDAGLSELFTVTDTLMSEQLGETEPIACKFGCGSCCIVNVAILYPEARLIADRIDASWEEERKRELADKLRELATAVRWLDDEERLLLRKPCAFLNEQAACSIHPFRPLLCRSVNSINAEQCREATVAVAFGDPPTIISNFFQKQLYESAYTGVAEALKEAKLPTRSGKLSSVLSAFLAVTTQERTPQLFLNSCRH